MSEFDQGFGSAERGDSRGPRRREREGHLLASHERIFGSTNDHPGRPKDSWSFSAGPARTEVARPRNRRAMRRSWAVRTSFGFVVLMASLIFGSQAFAVHDLHLFELDENATNNVAVAGDDWDQVFGGTSGAVATVFVADGDDFSGGITVPPGLPTNDTSYFTSGGSKDVNDINQWRHQTGDVAPDKDEILNAYAAAYVNTTDTANANPGDLIIYFGLDRLANNGDAQVGFWFFQGTHSLNPDGTFSGVHQVGDLLVLSHFTGGGAVDTIQVYEWVGPPDPDNLHLVGTGLDCALSTDDKVCAAVNDLTQDAPWPYVAKSPVKGQSANDFAPGSFYEGGLNVTALGLDIGCGGTFLAETRSSQSLDAQLKDFAIGDFSLCHIAVEKTGDTLSKVGDPADYTITITNDRAVPVFMDDITDTLLGDIVLDGVVQANPFVTDITCDDVGKNPLAPGDSCTITASRTVLASDPDPLPNTVTVVYKGRADLSGTAVSDTASHSVNLFQPDFTITKTGDTLSKNGDEVTYTFEIDNTSSTDSPDLNLVSISDTKLGDLAAAATAAGCDVLDSDPSETCSFQVNHTIPSDNAEDPYVNEVTAVYQVDGFPNQLTRSDRHSVNLFQPAIAVDKTGDELSKIGDDVNYTVTLSNNSSPDTPALQCTAVDSMFGTIFDGVLPPGDTVIGLSHTVLAGDPDPLHNSVTLTCSVTGFPNVLEKSDGHTTELFQPSVEVIKDGPSSAHVGDTITYTFVINNTSSGDSPNLVLDTVTDTVIGNLTPAATTAGCGTLPPNGSCNFSATYTVQAGDPDPLVNVVTVHYHPAGFPNDVTDNDDHSVRIERELAQLAHTATTCEEFITQTGDAVPPLTELTYGLQGGVINNVSPGVFFFYASYSVTGSQNQLVVDVVERFNAANGPLTDDFVVQQDQAFLYRVQDSTCTKITANVTTQIIGGQVVITYNPAGDVPTGTYVIGVKYTPSNALIGQAPCQGGATPCRYYFIPSRDGTEQTARAQSFLFRQR